MNGMGRRQREMLAELAVAGGHWPDGRRQSPDDRAVLASLARKGMVTLAGRRAALTPAGERFAVSVLLVGVPRTGVAINL